MNRFKIPSPEVRIVWHPPERGLLPGPSDDPEIWESWGDSIKNKNRKHNTNGDDYSKQQLSYGKYDISIKSVDDTGWDRIKRSDLRNKNQLPIHIKPLIENLQGNNFQTKSINKRNTENLPCYEKCSHHGSNSKKHIRQRKLHRQRDEVLKNLLVHETNYSEIIEAEPKYNNIIDHKNRLSKYHIHTRPSLNLQKHRRKHNYPDKFYSVNTPVHLSNGSSHTRELFVKNFISNSKRGFTVASETFAGGKLVTSGNSKKRFRGMKATQDINLRTEPHRRDVHDHNRKHSLIEKKKLTSFGDLEVQNYNSTLSRKYFAGSINADLILVNARGSEAPTPIALAVGNRIGQDDFSVFTSTDANYENLEEKQTEEEEEYEKEKAVGGCYSVYATVELTDENLQDEEQLLECDIHLPGTTILSRSSVLYFPGNNN